MRRCPSKSHAPRRQRPSRPARFARPLWPAKEAGPSLQEPPIPALQTFIARPEARPDAAELFFSSSGRLARTPFLAGLGAVLGALWLFGLIEGAARAVSAWAVLPVLAFSGCCLTSRRLHDLGRAGWWSAYPLALLVALWPAPRGDYRLICVATLAALAVWLCAMPGQSRPNRFGAALASSAP